MAGKFSDSESFWNLKRRELLRILWGADEEQKKINAWRWNDHEQSGSFTPSLECNLIEVEIRVFFVFRVDE
jgi:hypothetical protein